MIQKEERFACPSHAMNSNAYISRDLAFFSKLLCIEVMKKERTSVMVKTVDLTGGEVFVSLAPLENKGNSVGRMISSMDLLKPTVTVLTPFTCNSA